MESVFATMNALSVAPSDNMLISLLIAALIPFVSRHVYAFFYYTWPNILHQLLIRWMLHREVGVVQDEAAKGEASCEIMQNRLLQDMVLDYLGYLSSLDQQRRNTAKQENDSPTNTTTTPEEANTTTFHLSGSNDLFIPNLNDLAYAQFRYSEAPFLLGHTAANNIGADGKPTHGVSSMVDVLRTNYAVTVVPSHAVAVEVEPGMYLEYHSHVEVPRGDTEAKASDEDAKKLAGAATRLQAYLMHDLLAQTTPEGADGRGSWLQGPFKPPVPEEVECTDSDDSELEPMESAGPSPRKMIFTCCTIRDAQVRQLVSAVARRRAEQQGETFDEAQSVNPRDRIESFLRRARQFYTQRCRDANQNARYLYYPCCTEVEHAVQVRAKKAGGDDDDDYDNGTAGDVSLRKVQRYQLPSQASSSKSFSSIFFDRKKEMMRVFGEFSSRTGKYAVPGVAHKLTMLLHGPPGTGKTSLVKAMAKELNRDVVVISLASIHTKTAFMEWLNDQHVRCRGEVDYQLEEGGSDCWSNDYYYEDETPKSVHLDPRKVIYLLEDIDAVGTELATAKDEDEDEIGAAEASATPETTHVPAEDDEEEGNDEGSTSTTTHHADEEIRTSHKSSTSHEDAASGNTSSGAHDDGCAERKSSSCSSSEDDDEEEDDDVKAEKKMKRLMALIHSIMKEFEQEALDMETILRVLNGVVAPDGRVVVMTTNHPEKLDKRLLKPGVLSLALHMGDINIANAINMVQHYFQETMTLEQKESMQKIILQRHARAGRSAHEAASINPAHLEQLCADVDDVEAVLRALSREEEDVMVF